jgi:hypothetical protein
MQECYLRTGDHVSVSKLLRIWVLGVVCLTSMVWGQRLQPEDFVYLGAFAIDANYSTPNDWNAYGQRGMSFDSAGDPGSSDAFPGSLWITGHDYERYVFELTIPTPSPNIFDWNRLPKPRLLTVPTQFTNGCNSDTEWFSGVEVHGNSIWGSCTNWYNVSGEDLTRVMWRRKLSDLSNLEGPFHAGTVGDPEFHSNRQGQYLMSIPADWAAAHLGGKTLATGLNRANFGGSQGPTLLAFDPDDPSDGYDLLYYRDLDPCYGNKDQCDYPGYTLCDYWSSATWVRTSTSDTVLISGKKYYGENNYDGGWLCDPGFGAIIFYDAGDLADRIDGSIAPWNVTPYATWHPTELWWADSELGGITFDRDNGYLYVIETYAWYDGTAIVHVYQTEGGRRIFADGFESGRLDAWVVNP